MTTHIKLIYWALDVAERNLEEAERYVKKAHALRMQYKPAADWCIEMAKRHLDFNGTANVLLDGLCREMGDATGEGDIRGAIRAAINERRERLAEDTAEVKAKINVYDGK